tara:strand:- start:8676 stop:9179 length:504 start_codon:yes stop_codon:yes gene_type:complete
MTAPKKKLTKKVAKPVAKKEEIKLPSISAKQVGRNLTVTIGKKIKTITKPTEELTPVKDLLKKYQVTPTKFLLDKIEKSLVTDKSKAFKEKDNEEKEKKADLRVKKKIAEKTSDKNLSNLDAIKSISKKDLTEEEKKELRKLLAEEGAKEQPKVEVTREKRGYESYR